MAIFDVPAVGGLETLEDVRNYLYRMDRELRYQFGGSLNSKNISEISGWSVDEFDLISSNGLVGLSSQETTFTDVRMWAGSSVRETAPFRVLEDGSMVATNAQITGNIAMTGGTISWGSINTPGNFTKIGSTYIYTGTLNADQINVGTLTGFTIQTGFGGRRVVMDTSGFRSHDPFGTKRISIENDNSSWNNHQLLFSGDDSITRGLLYANNGSFTLSATNGAVLFLGSGNGMGLIGGTPYFDFSNVTIEDFSLPISGGLRNQTDYLQSQINSLNSALSGKADYYHSHSVTIPSHNHGLQSVAIQQVGGGSAGTFVSSGGGTYTVS